MITTDRLYRQKTIDRNDNFTYNVSLISELDLHTMLYVMLYVNTYYV